MWKAQTQCLKKLALWHCHTACHWSSHLPGIGQPHIHANGQYWANKDIGQQPAWPTTAYFCFKTAPWCYYPITLQIRLEISLSIRLLRVWKQKTNWFEYVDVLQNNRRCIQSDWDNGTYRSFVCANTLQCQRGKTEFNWWLQHWILDSSSTIMIMEQKFRTLSQGDPNHGGTYQFPIHILLCRLDWRFPHQQGYSGYGNEKSMNKMVGCPFNHQNRWKKHLIACDGNDTYIPEAIDQLVCSG